MSSERPNDPTKDELIPDRSDREVFPDPQGTMRTNMEIKVDQDGKVGPDGPVIDVRDGGPRNLDKYEIAELRYVGDWILKNYKPPVE